MNTFPNIAFCTIDSHTQPIEIVPLDEFYQGYLPLPSQTTSRSFLLTPHRVLFYMIIMIEEGEVEHFLDGQNYQIKADQVMLIRPQQVHAFQLSHKHDNQTKQATPIKGRLIVFTPQIWESIKENVGAEFSRSLSWSTTFENIHNLSQEDQEQALAILSLLQKNHLQPAPDDTLQWLHFTALLRILTRDWPNGVQLGNKKPIDAFLRFSELLIQQFKISRDAKFYASQLGMSYKNLNQICKDTSKLTAKQVIDNLVVLEAKRMLLADDQTTQRVADALGFDESTNFVKFFKRHTGKTPKEYRLK